MKKLIDMQAELKAPKGRTNSFGGYKYRSCEDILEAVKPILKKYDCSLSLSDELKNIGDRYYIEAIAELVDNDNNERVTVTAFARETETKKGQDESQITGTASSYARKYALNGLFLIDDTKDADTDEYRAENTNRAHKTTAKEVEQGEEQIKKDLAKKLTKTEQKTFRDFIADKGIEEQKVIAAVGKPVEEWTGNEKQKAWDYIKGIEANGQ